LANFSKIDQWKPLRSSGVKVHAPIRAFLFTVVAGHFHMVSSLKNKSAITVSIQNEREGFLITPIMFRNSSSQTAILSKSAQFVI